MSETTEKLFEKASRDKLKFSYKGQIKTEDLWDLSLEELNEIYETLDAQYEKATKASLLKKKTPADEKLDLQMKIVEYIFKTKQEEAETRLKEREISAQEQKILKAIAAQEEKELEGLTADQLREKLANLRN